MQLLLSQINFSTYLCSSPWQEEEASHRCPTSDVAGCREDETASGSCPPIRDADQKTAADSCVTAAQSTQHVEGLQGEN